MSWFCNKFVNGFHHKQIIDFLCTPTDVFEFVFGNDISEKFKSQINTCLSIFFLEAKVVTYFSTSSKFSFLISSLVEGEDTALFLVGSLA